MRRLLERWPGLRTLPSIELADLPTPVRRLDSLSATCRSEVWGKLDDRTGEPYGGNKVRKLEWFLGDAERQGCDTLVTIGAFGSHHVLATALYGARHGFDVHAVLFPQPPTRHVEEQVRADLAAGARLHPVRGYAPAAARVGTLVTGFRLRGRRPYVIPPGGSSPVGTLGFVEAGLELADQIAARELPEPAAVYVPAGSGATCVGVALGLAATGLMTRVVAVRVTDALAINRPRLTNLTRRTVALLQAADDRFPSVEEIALGNLVIDPSHRGRGYGVETDAGRRAAELAIGDSLRVEPTYTAKALAAVIDAGIGAGTRGHRGPLLFWQTFNSRPMAPLLKGAPPLPEWARR